MAAQDRGEEMGEQSSPMRAMGSGNGERRGFLFPAASLWGQKLNRHCWVGCAKGCGS